jgi:hypothetical protein
LLDPLLAASLARRSTASVEPFVQPSADSRGNDGAHDETRQRRHGQRHRDRFAVERDLAEAR